MNRFVGNGQFQLNVEDVKKWAKNIILFAGPALLIGMTMYQQTGNIQTARTAFMVALYGIVVDLLRKFLADNTK